LSAALQQQVLGCLMVAARQGELAGRLLPLELLSAATGGWLGGGAGGRVWVGGWVGGWVGWVSCMVC
jgi:hypothetical protein